MNEQRRKPHEPLPEYYRPDEDKPDYLNRLFDISARDYDRIIQWVFPGTGEANRRRALMKAGLHEDELRPPWFGRKMPLDKSRDRGNLNFRNQSANEW